MTSTQTPNALRQFPTKFRFTESRRDILSLLVKYVNLTTKDFYRLLPPPSHRIDSHERDTRRTLHDFEKKGYLVRRRWYDDERHDTPFPVVESVYSLSREGLRLAREKGLANGQGKHADHSSRRNESLAHELEITRFHLAVDTLAKTVLWRQTDLRRGVNPDALLAVREEDGSGFFYFLEIEKSKQGHYVDGESGLVKKLGSYYLYQRSNECKRDWEHFNEFRVIIVVKNEERRRNLLKALAEKYRSRMFWITTTELYRTDIGRHVFLTPRDFTDASYSLLG